MIYEHIVRNNYMQEKNKEIIFATATAENIFYK
jgi:hypothetical protein